MILKRFPEDFIVEEIPNFDTGTLKESGEFFIHKLWKMNLNTEEAIHLICNKFNIQRNRIKYSGTKDRNAVTIQYISIEHKKINFEDENLKIEFIGHLGEPLSLGSLKGNRFTIKVREVKAYDEKKAFPNYFDDQRFSKSNLKIGIHILKKEYKKAVEAIIENKGKYELKVLGYFQDNSTNYVGALNLIPKKILSMYIHSVQSFVFNELLRLEVEKACGGENIEVDYSEGKLAFPANELSESQIQGIPESLPLVGFDTILDNNIRKLMDSLGIAPKDFIIRSIPDLTCESTSRKSFSEINDLKVESSSDVHGDFIRFSFWLDKGSYATMAIKCMCR